MKRLLMTLTLIFILCLSAFTLTACQAPHVHTFDQEVVAEDFLASEATCTEKAKYYYSCKCGTKDETLTFEIGEKLGHSFIDYAYDNNATCTEDGTETATCDRPDCNEQDSRIKVGSALSHAFINYNSNSSATCVENATEIAVCDRADCQETHIREIPNTALNHNYGNWVSNGDGTHTQTCANDNSHKITEVCNGGEATCTEKATCNDCGAKYGKLADHKYIKQVAEDKYLDKAVTCTSKAKYFYSCECGEKGTESFEYGEALNHNYGNWVSNGDGTHTQTCANDNSHKITKGCNGGEATCTEKATCNDCGAKYGELKAHTYSQLYNFDKTHHWQDATCGCELKQNNGEHTPDSSGFCTVCDKPINPTEGVLYDYSSDGTYIEVIGYEGTSNRVKIADTYDNLPVKAIYAEAFKRTNITSIEIPASVTSIGDNAFYDCDSLESVTFGENSQLTSIGGMAFGYCDSLESVTFGENSQLTSIGYSAFGYCDSLESIEIPASVTCIGDYAFSSCGSLESVTFGENSQLTSIGYYAFDDCHSLYLTENNLKYVKLNGNSYYILIEAANNNFSTYKINSQTKYIEAEAFGGCTRLSSITVPASVTSIGDRAFFGCYSLESVTFGENSQLTSIGDDAFGYCKSLKTIEIPASVTSLGDEAFFRCDLLTSIEISAGVTSIGDNAFYECGSLESVTFGENSQLTSIGDDAFNNCISLTSIEIPVSVTSIGDMAFYDCDSLESVTFGENSQLTSIGGMAFGYCDSLESIEIPASVTSIGTYAFNNCTSLTSVVFENPNGWWHSYYFTATSGTSISSSYLSNPSTAATYLKSTYLAHYWKRS